MNESNLHEVNPEHTFETSVDAFRDKIILKGQLKDLTSALDDKNGKCRCDDYEKRLSSMLSRIEEIEKRIPDQDYLARTLEHTQQINHFEKALADLTKQFADIQGISTDTERMRGRLDQEETNLKQLVEKVSTSEKKIEDIAQRVVVKEADYKTLKDQFAGIQNVTSEVHKMSARLDKITETSSQLAEKLSAEDQKIEDMAKRIIEGEITSKALISFAVRNESTEPLPEGTETVTWKMSGYKSKWEAVYVHNRSDSRITEGPTFYTEGMMGYKLGTSYKMADQAARVGIHVLPGVYDTLLKWPFVAKINITLVDQNVQPGKSEATIYTTNDSRVITTCPKEWGRNFKDYRSQGCFFGLLFDKELNRRQLVKDDSLLIVVQVQVL